VPVLETEPGVVDRARQRQNGDVDEGGHQHPDGQYQAQQRRKQQSDPSQRALKVDLALVIAVHNFIIP